MLYKYTRKEREANSRMLAEKRVSDLRELDGKEVCIYTAGLPIDGEIRVSEDGELILREERATGIMEHQGLNQKKLTHLFKKSEKHFLSGIIESERIVNFIYEKHEKASASI